MKKVLIRSTISILIVTAVVGGIAAYFILSSQDRGMTKDGRMAPPASVRNAPEAPKYDASKPAEPGKTAEQTPEYQLPTEFKLPTEMDISAPKVPDDIAAPASGENGAKS